MNKIIIMLIAIASLLMPLRSYASGVLLDFKGKINVTIPGKTAVKALSGLELPNGSVISVGKGGSASVLMESGAVDEIAPETKYTVGKTRITKGRTNFGSGIALAMRELAASGEGPTVHGMVKKVAGQKDVRIDFGALGKVRSGLKGIYPIETAIRLKNSMTFLWNSAIADSDAIIVIEDAQKKQLADLSLKAGDAEFTAPCSNLRLAKGKAYTWYLAAKDGKNVKAKTARFNFTTLSDPSERSLDSDIAKIKGLNMNEAGKVLLIAQSYFQHNLLDDMVRTLLPQYQQQPSPFAKKLLFLGYSRMGNTEEMEKYR